MPDPNSRLSSQSDDYETPDFSVLYKSTIELDHVFNKATGRFIAPAYEKLRDVIIPELRKKYIAGARNSQEPHRLKQIDFIQTLSNSLEKTDEPEKKELIRSILMGACFHRFLRIEHNYAKEKAVNKFLSWFVTCKPDNSVLYGIIKKDFGITADNPLDSMTLYESLRDFKMHLLSHREKIDKTIPFKKKIEVSAEEIESFHNKIKTMVDTADKASMQMQHQLQAIRFLKSLAQELNKAHDAAKKILSDWKDKLKGINSNSEEAIFKIAENLQVSQDNPGSLDIFNDQLKKIKQALTKENKNIDQQNLGEVSQKMELRLNCYFSLMLVAAYKLLLHHNHINKTLKEMLADRVAGNKKEFTVELKKNALTILKKYLTFSPKLDMEFWGKEGAEMFARHLERVYIGSIESEEQLTQQALMN